MSRTIGLVEDEAAIRENYIDILSRHGYEVLAYPNRPKAMAAFNNRLPDLVIVDVGLEHEPEGGFDLCRDLRAMAPKLPIIFLSARDSDFDVISGLRLGADDYLTKDISLPHLVARIAALFRRQDTLTHDDGGQSEVLERGQLKLDTDRMEVSWAGQPVNLTLTEFWLVHALGRYPGHVKNRQQLMDAANAVWDDSTITSHVKRIRKKFLAIDGSFNCIKTAYGAGYRWIEEE